MRFFTILLVVLFSIQVQAEPKDVFKKVPKRFDTVIKLDVKKFLDISHVQQIMKIMTEVKEPMAQFRKSLGIGLEDLKSVYLCGNLKQFFDAEGNIKREREIGKMLMAGSFDLMLFAELYKPLDLKKLEKNLPKELKVTEIEKVKCFKFDDEELQYPHAAVFTPKFIGITPGYSVKEMITLADDKTILGNKKIVELLKENGFGGIISIVHAGQFIKAPGPAPWVKDYRGGVLNAWFTEKEGAELELTTSYHTLESVRNASLMAQLGLNFLDTKPELKLIKEGITIKVEGNNLLLDFKMKNTFFSGLIDKMELSLNEARRKAKRAMSMSNQKQLAIAIFQYSSDHKGETPDKIEDLKEYIGSEEDLKKLLKCPVTGQEYTYTKPAGKMADINEPEKTAILFSKTDRGTITTFLDGHVEFIKGKK